MIRRIVLIVIVVGGLLALLDWSQRRTEPFHVSGFIEAHEARVGSRVGGRVQVVNVEEGQIVKPGDVLVTLEPFDLPARRAQAVAEAAKSQSALAELEIGFRPEDIAQTRARYNQAQANLADLERGSRVQEISAARAQLDDAQAALVLAQAEFDRITPLVKTGVMTRDDLDRATSTLRSAKATVESRRQSLGLLEAGTRVDQIVRAREQVAETSHALTLMLHGNRKEDIDQARAALDAARAQVEMLDQQIAELTVKAPLAGRVEAVELRPGDLIGPDAPMLSILDLSTLWVRAYIPENRLDLKVGELVKVTVDSFPGRQFAGKLTFIAQQAEFTPNNVQTPEDRSKQVLRIKVTLQEGLELLHPGMSADVWLGGEMPRQ